MTSSPPLPSLASFVLEMPLPDAGITTPYGALFAPTLSGAVPLYCIDIPSKGTYSLALPQEVRASVVPVLCLESNSVTLGQLGGKDQLIPSDSEIPILIDPAQWIATAHENPARLLVFAGNQGTFYMRDGLSGQGTGRTELFLVPSNPLSIAVTLRSIEFAREQEYPSCKAPITMYVVSGSGVLTVDGYEDNIELNPGICCCIPPESRYVIQRTSTEPLRLASADTA